MYGGAWWAHGAAKSQTQLSDFTFSEGKGAADPILQVLLQDIRIWRGGWRESVGRLEERLLYPVNHQTEGALRLASKLSSFNPPRQGETLPLMYNDSAVFLWATDWQGETTRYFH